MVQAAKLGLGIGELPNVDSIMNSPDLINILPNVQLPELPLHYIFERHREKSPVISEVYKALV